MGDLIKLAGTPPFEVPIETVEAPDFILRISYEGEEGELLELGQSMLKEGQMHAISVLDLGDGKYRFVAGDRRLRAARSVQASTIWVTVIPPRSEADVICYQMEENIHTKQLDPYEEAAGYTRLIDLGLSIPEIARRVKRREERIRRSLLFATAAAGVHELVVQGGLKPSKAAEIARLPSGDDQARVAETVAKHNLTLPQTRELVQRVRTEPQQGKIRHYLSKEKTIAEAARTVRWLHRVAADTNFRGFTSDDRSEWNQAFGVEMKSALNSVLDCIQRIERNLPKSQQAIKAAGNVPVARNHGDEWPANDVKRLETWMKSRVRKPIAKFAEELGRTVTAVNEMRRQLRKKRRA